MTILDRIRKAWQGLTERDYVRCNVCRMELDVTTIDDLHEARDHMQRCNESANARALGGAK